MHKGTSQQDMVFTCHAVGHLLYARTPEGPSVIHEVHFTASLRYQIALSFYTLQYAWPDLNKRTVSDKLRIIGDKQGGVRAWGPCLCHICEVLKLLRGKFSATVCIVALTYACWEVPICHAYVSLMTDCCMCRAAYICNCPESMHGLR